MPGISRKDDICGGALINSQSTVKVNSKYAIVDQDDIAPHAPGGAHNTSKIVAVSKSVFIGGIKVAWGHVVIQLMVVLT